MDLKSTQRQLNASLTVEFRRAGLRGAKCPNGGSFLANTGTRAIALRLSAEKADQE
jgi:hypothetical protein